MTCFRGSCPCGKVAVVKKSSNSECMGCRLGPKKWQGDHYGEVAVGGGLTVALTSLMF